MKQPMNNKSGYVVVGTQASLAEMRSNSRIAARATENDMAMVAMNGDH